MAGSGDDLRQMLTTRIRQLREAHSLTVGQLAERLGISAGQQSRIESGIRPVTFEDLFGPEKDAAA